MAAPVRGRLPGWKQGPGESWLVGGGAVLGDPRGKPPGHLGPHHYIGPMWGLWIGGKLLGHPALRLDSTLLLRTEVTHPLPVLGSPGEGELQAPPLVKAVSRPLGPPPSPALLSKIPGNPLIPSAPPQGPWGYGPSKTTDALSPRAVPTALLFTTPSCLFSDACLGVRCLGEGAGSTDSLCSQAEVSLPTEGLGNIKYSWAQPLVGVGWGQGQ